MTSKREHVTRMCAKKYFQVFIQQVNEPPKDNNKFYGHTPTLMHVYLCTHRSIQCNIPASIFGNF